MTIDKELVKACLFVCPARYSSGKGPCENGVKRVLNGRRWGRRIWCEGRKVKKCFCLAKKLLT